MFRTKKKTRKTISGVEFCDACGTVCDAGCRADRLRDQARDAALRNQFAR